MALNMPYKALMENPMNCQWCTGTRALLVNLSCYCMYHTIVIFCYNCVNPLPTVSLDHYQSAWSLENGRLCALGKINEECIVVISTCIECTEPSNASQNCNCYNQVQMFI